MVASGPSQVSTIPRWSNSKLERRGVQHLASAISIAESLIKFKRKFLKGQGKEARGDGKGEGYRDKSPKKDKPSNDKWKSKKDEAPKKYSCFLYKGPHRVFEFPERASLSPLCKKRERSKRRREGSPRSCYLMPYVPRLNDNPMGECTWKPLSMVNRYKPC